MTEKPKREVKAEASASIYCPRIQKPVSVEEQDECPHCLGTRGAEAGGKNEVFCDYNPYRDAVWFDYPYD